MAAFFDHLAKLVEDLVAVEQLAALRLGRAFFKSCPGLQKSFLTFPFMALKQMQRLSNHLARCLVAPRVHPALKKSVELRVIEVLTVVLLVAISYELQVLAHCVKMLPM